MAVGATNHALGHLPLQSFFGCAAADHDADIALLLTLDVIEFKDHDIAFAAVDAWMRIQVLPQKLPYSFSLTARANVSALIVRVFVFPIVILAVCPLAAAAIRDREKLSDLTR
jgi:hypothetical protein